MCGSGRKATPKIEFTVIVIVLDCIRIYNYVQNAVVATFCLSPIPINLHRKLVISTVYNSVYSRMYAILKLRQRYGITNFIYYKFVTCHFAFDSI